VYAARYRTPEHAPFPVEWHPPASLKPGAGGVDARRSVWRVTRKMRVPLVDGWRPFWACVVQDCRVLVAQRAAAAQGAGCRIVGLKTDCVWVSPRLPPSPKTGDPSTYGSFSVADAESLPGPHRPSDQAKVLRAAAMINAATPQQPPMVQNIALMNERHAGQLVEALAPGHVLLEATSPGCGKTTAFATFCAATKMRGLIVPPYNALREDIDRSEFPGIEAATVCSVLGLRLADGQLEVKEGLDVSGVQCILWDEVQQNSLGMLARIFAYEAAHPDKLFFYTADYRQLGAIESLRFTTDVESMTYYRTILLRHMESVAGGARVLTLRQCKRVSSEWERAAIDQFLGLVWGGPWTPDRRAAVFALPLLSRRLSSLSEIVPGTRVVTYFRASATAFGRALHSVSPMLEDGAPPAAPPAAPPPPPPPPPLAPKLLPPPKKKQLSGFQKRKNSEAARAGLPPPYSRRSAAVVARDPDDAKEAADDASKRGPVRDADEDTATAEFPPHLLLRCTKPFAAGDGRFYVNVEYVVVRHEDGVVLRPARPTPLTGEWESTVSLSRVRSSFAYVAGQTCHSLQGASVDAPLFLIADWKSQPDRRWLTTAVTRVRRLATLALWVGPPPHL